jgi:adenosylhomocysteine nucleosidase
MRLNPDFVVIISANAEWQIIRKYYPGCRIYYTPYGEWFSFYYKDHPSLEKSIVFMHGGWGKVAAAASTQFVIYKWRPKMVINIGTCGGFEGKISKGEIILVEKTLIYDIYEQMGDSEEHISDYVTELDTSWLSKPLPLHVVRTLLVSGDRDLFCEEISSLNSRYGAIAGDWESGAIAWVAAKNQTQCLILRGVTDLVGENGGEAYAGNVSFYYENTELVMKKIIESLPQWLLKYKSTYSDLALK